MPELTDKKKNKTIIFVFGSPGSGKSSFVEYFIMPKLSNFKIFDPDKYINLLDKLGREKVVRSEEEKENKLNSIKTAIHRLKAEYDVPINLTDKQIMDMIDRNVYMEGVDRVIENQLSIFMSQNKYSDIIIDTTGTNFNKISKYNDMARKNGYNVLFIKLRADVKTSVISNLKRSRKVQIDYQLSTIEKGNELEVEYLKLGPDAYYVYDRDNNTLFKYINNELVIKKQRLIKNY